MIEYTHHSPSSLNLFAASPSTWVAEKIKGWRQPANAPMCRGRACEDGVTHGLFNSDASLDECYDKAYATYDTGMAFTSDPRREVYRDTIPAMVKQALTELRKYGEPSGTQEYVEWRPDGLRLPIIGYSDYRWDHHGIIADLKTTERMPSEIKIGHARQVALYAVSDNVDARLIYVTPKKLEPMRLENVRAHRQALCNIAKTVELWLSLSNDPEFFVQMTAPDVDSYYWTNPDARQYAFEIWGI